MNSSDNRIQRILVVDDIEGNIISLEATLESLQNLEIDTASDGWEAARLIKQNHYSLLLVDVQMPGMDGFQLYELVRKSPNFEDVPVVFISANYIQDADIEEAFGSGALDYLVKPFSPELLKAKVARYLQWDRTKEELRQNRAKLDQCQALSKKMESGELSLESAASMLNQILQGS